MQTASEAEVLTLLAANVMRIELSLVAVCAFGALQGHSLAAGRVAAVAAVVPDVGTDLVG